MAQHSHRGREYAAQQMLTNYQSGQNVGDAYGGAEGEIVTAIASLATGLIGMGVGGAANKKAREHESEMAALTAQSNALSLKSQELGMMAQLQAGAAANKRAITYASAGFASVVILGGLAYLGMRKRKK